MTFRQYLQVKYFCNYILNIFTIAAICLPLLSLCSILLTNESIAEPSKLNLSTISPVKLVSTANRTCGSGFVFGKQIITNFHVANAICQQSACSNIKIFSLLGEIKASQDIQFTIRSSAPAYDLSVIEIKANEDNLIFNLPSAKDLLEQNNKINKNSELIAFSFPNCAGLEITAGNKLASIENLYFLSSLALQHGSSGGAIFNNQGDLSGIISESNTFLEGISSMIMGTRFRQTRAIPLDRLLEILSYDQKSSFDFEIKALLEFYFKIVLKHSGIQRIEESSRFLSKIKALALSHISDTKGAAALLLALDNYPYPLFLSNNWGLAELNQDTAALAFAASIEQYGLRESFTKQINSEELKILKSNLLQRFSTQENLISNIFDACESSRYPGATLYLLAALIPCLSFLLIALFIWLIGLGALFAKAKIGIFKKMTRIAIWSFCMLLLVLIILTILY